VSKRIASKEKVSKRIELSLFAIPLLKHCETHPLTGVTHAWAVERVTKCTVDISSLYTPLREGPPNKVEEGAPFKLEGRPTIQS
jgi:hypothetical protein